VSGPPRNRTCQCPGIRLEQALQVRWREAVRSNQHGVDRPRVRSPRPASRRLTCPLVRASSSSSLSGSPDRVSTLSRPGTKPGVRPVMHDHRLEDRHHRRGFPLSFGHRHSLFGHPAPAGESSPPHGRPAGPQVRTSTGFPRSAHTSCDRGGRPLCPGDNGAHPGRGHFPAGVCRIATACPCPRRTSHRRGCA